MTVAIAASFLVLPDGGGLARFAKFPGAPLMTALLIFVVVRRLPAAIRGARRPIGARRLRDVA
jgi:alpha-1,6-mannosyltransferase